MAPMSAASTRPSPFKSAGQAVPWLVVIVTLSIRRSKSVSPKTRPGWPVVKTIESAPASTSAKVRSAGSPGSKVRGSSAPVPPQPSGSSAAAGFSTLTDHVVHSPSPTQEKRYQTETQAYPGGVSSWSRISTSQGLVTSLPANEMDSAFRSTESVKFSSVEKSRTN